MTNLPALVDPLVPPDTDVRHFSRMSLDVARLRDSDFVALTTPEEFKAGVLLWAAAWHQVPASSLPDDDRILAKITFLPLADWKSVREMALHGFIKCADGRLYHPLISDLALEATAKSRVGRFGAESRWRRHRATKVDANASENHASASHMSDANASSLVCERIENANASKSDALAMQGMERNGREEEALRDYQDMEPGKGVAKLNGHELNSTNWKPNYNPGEFE